MADHWQRIPIFYVDGQGFATYNANTQQTIVRRVHDMATEAAREFIPDGDVWSTWRRHGRGDGYYFLLIGASPQEALQYALRFNATSSARRVVRGGSWDPAPLDARATVRFDLAPDLRVNHAGLRLVRGVPFF